MHNSSVYMLAGCLPVLCLMDAYCMCMHGMVACSSCSCCEVYAYCLGKACMHEHVPGNDIPVVKLFAYVYIVHVHDFLVVQSSCIKLCATGAHMLVFSAQDLLKYRSQIFMKFDAGNGASWRDCDAAT